MRVVAFGGEHPLQLRLKSRRTADASAANITGAQRHDLGMRATGEAESRGRKQSGNQAENEPDAADAVSGIHVVILSCLGGDLAISRRVGQRRGRASASYDPRNRPAH
jgi:hypothetical protein